MSRAGGVIGRGELSIGKSLRGGGGVSGLGDEGDEVSERCKAGGERESSCETTLLG